jgi:hypothetical protein
MICYVRNLVWLLPKLNKVLIPTTYRAKTHNSQFTMGVEIIMHLQTIISQNCGTFKDLDKCHVCSASQYKTKTRSFVDDMQGTTRETKLRCHLVYICIAMKTNGNNKQ